MELYVKSSGGLANLMIDGKLDLADLPEDLRHRIEEVLGPDREMSHGVGDATALPGLESVDTMHYQLKLVNEADVRTFEIDEAVAPPEVLELVDELMYELNRRRMRERRGEAPSETAAPPSTVDDGAPGDGSV